MRFDPEKIRKNAKENFDFTWNQGKKLIRTPTLNERYPRIAFKFGKEHPVYATIQKLREAYLRMGFEEMMNPLIVDDKEVHKQFGSEALAVLDRCFYLAGLPRPNVGISDESIVQSLVSSGTLVTMESIKSGKFSMHTKKGRSMEMILFPRFLWLLKFQTRLLLI